MVRWLVGWLVGWYVNWSNIWRRMTTNFLSVRCLLFSIYKVTFYNISNGNFKWKITVKKLFLYDAGDKSYMCSNTGQIIFCSIWRQMVYLRSCIKLSAKLPKYKNTLLVAKRQLQEQENCEKNISVRWPIEKLYNHKVRSIFMYIWSDVILMYPTFSINFHSTTYLFLLYISYTVNKINSRRFSTIFRR